MRLRFHGARLDIQASPDAVRITSDATVDVVLPVANAALREAASAPGAGSATTQTGEVVRVVPGEVRRWRRAGDVGWELE